MTATGSVRRASALALKMPQENSRSHLSFGQGLTVFWSRTLFATASAALSFYRGETAVSVQDYRYGALPDERLEVIGAGGNSFDTPVVFVHGGGWMMGSKEFYRSDLIPFSEAGFTVYSLEYPKAPEHPHPQLIRSVLNALMWIRRERGATRVHLVGDSAGGNLALMAGLYILNPELLEIVGINGGADAFPIPVSCTSLYGVVDRPSCLDGRVPGGRAMIAAYGGQEALESDVTPQHAITPSDLPVTGHPPCFLACGTEDVLFESNLHYYESLVASGHDAAFKAYDGANHGFLSFPRNAQRDTLLQDTLAFLERMERGQSTS